MKLSVLDPQPATVASTQHTRVPRMVTIALLLSSMDRQITLTRGWPPNRPRRAERSSSCHQQSLCSRYTPGTFREAKPGGCDPTRNVARQAVSYRHTNRE